MEDQSTDNVIVPKFTPKDLLEGKVPLSEVQKHGEQILKTKDPYKEIKPEQSIFTGVRNAVGDLFNSNKISYNRKDEINKIVPDYIPEEYRDTVATEAQRIGVKAENLAKLMKKENSLFNPRAVGQIDNNDIGLMQINKANFPMIRERFKEKGLTFNPYDPYHSIMAAAMILEEHKKSELINNEEDLITSYNTGPKTIFKAKQGDVKAIERVTNYRKGIFD